LLDGTGVNALGSKIPLRREEMRKGLAACPVQAAVAEGIDYALKGAYKLPQTDFLRGRQRPVSRDTITS